MEIRIYQAPGGHTSRHGGEVSRAGYCQVYEGRVACTSLEGVYYQFNMNPPRRYAGNGLALSDVIEVVRSDTLDPGFYLCDTYGFREVAFAGSPGRPG